jgi:hypothetical protein
MDEMGDAVKRCWVCDDPLEPGYIEPFTTGPVGLCNLCQEEHDKCEAQQEANIKRELEIYLEKQKREREALERAMYRSPEMVQLEIDRANQPTGGSFIATIVIAFVMLNVFLVFVGLPVYIMRGMPNESDIGSKAMIVVFTLGAFSLAAYHFGKSKGNGNG